MNLLQITGAVREGGAKKLEKLLATLDQERARSTSEKMLEGTRSIGESHESISAALEEANRALASVRGAEETLGRARATLASEFEARRSDRSELVAVTALLEQTSEELGEARQVEAELQRRMAAAEDALAESRAAKLQVELLASSREAEVARLTSSLNASRAEGLELRTNGERAVAHAQRLEDDNGRLRVKLEEGEVRRQQAEAEAAEAVQASSLMDVERGVLVRKVESLTGDLNRLTRQAAELEASLTTEKSRARALESTAQSATAEAERLGRLMEEQADKARAQIETSELRMETAQARTARLEEDNAELSRQLREAAVRDRLAERESGELKLKLKQGDDQIASLAADLMNSRKELASVEAARAAAVDRSERLMETSEARAAEIARLEQQIDVINGRYELLAQGAANDRAAADARAKSLAAAVERERSERHLASGALEAARKDRARLHIEVLKSNRGGAESEDLEEKVG